MYGRAAGMTEGSDWHAEGRVQAMVMAHLEQMGDHVVCGHGKLGGGD